MSRPAELGTPDVVILPGTKSTLDDLVWLRQSGLEAAILKLAAAGVPVVGICGGYQMLGRTLSDPEGTEGGTPGAVCRGLGLLPADTVFCADKTRTRVEAEALAGPFAGAKLEGYEIHMGQTRVEGAPFCRLADGRPEGCAAGHVYGTYLHGLFDSGEANRKTGPTPSAAPKAWTRRGRCRSLIGLFRNRNLTVWRMPSGAHWTWMPFTG